MRLAVLIFALVFAAPAAAQVKPDIRPGDEPAYEDVPLTPRVDRDRVIPDLAYVLGELHYLAFACEGNHSQAWRNQMQELLDLEAPASGYWRERLIDNFNNGFRDQQRYRLTCGAQVEAERRELASRGRQLSDALLEPLLAEDDG
ncbi:MULTISPECIES: TIGR02301 family protein [Hyphobacterium]|uniref:TIGR02301 family protein n=1 Tax=Hyphobacterium vulgare TaxID=1736751 RepID=A0ABV6ZUX6_9PROT